MFFHRPLAISSLHKGSSSSSSSLQWRMGCWRVLVLMMGFCDIVTVIGQNDDEYLLHLLMGHTAPVDSVDWSPDGSKLASGSRDRSLKIWDPNSGILLQDLEALFGSSEDQVAWSPDGTMLASAGNAIPIKIWDPTEGQVVLTLEGRRLSMVTSIAWSPDGTKLACADGTIMVWIWDVMTGELLNSLEHEGYTSSVIWSPDGLKLASATTRESVIRIWDPNTGQVLQKLEGHTASVMSVDWSLDGTKLASGSLDKTIRIWNADSGQLMLSLWNAGWQTPYGIFDMDSLANQVYSVAWSPDGTQLASGGGAVYKPRNYDNFVRIWNPVTGALLRNLTGHSEVVLSVTWSPDGTKLASGSYDETTRIWEVAGAMAGFSPPSTTKPTLPPAPNPTFCGDGHCDDGETSENCSEDCPVEFLLTNVMIYFEGLPHQICAVEYLEAEIDPVDASSFTCRFYGIPCGDSIANIDLVKASKDYSGMSNEDGALDALQRRMESEKPEVFNQFIAYWREKDTCEPVDPDVQLVGYVFWPTYDSKGYEISQQTFSALSELAAECDNDSSCKGFNTFGSMKSYVKPLHQWVLLDPVSERHGLYIKTPETFFVNGNKLKEEETKWMKWIAKYTIPNLGLSRYDAVNKIARGAWWSLKEGVLNVHSYRPIVPNPFHHSFCKFENGTQHQIGPLDVCPGGIGLLWQVGIAGEQPKEYTLDRLESLARELYGNVELALSQTAKQNEFEEGSKNYIEILESDGDLRRGWLTKNHLVGFTLVSEKILNRCNYPNISEEDKKWCGPYYRQEPCPSCSDTRYATKLEDIHRYIDDVRILLQSLVGTDGIQKPHTPASPPQPTTPPPPPDELRLTDVMKYFECLPHQICAVEYLEARIDPMDASDFTCRFRDKPTSNTDCGANVGLIEASKHYYKTITHQVEALDILQSQIESKKPEVFNQFIAYWREKETCESSDTDRVLCIARCEIGVVADDPKHQDKAGRIGDYRTATTIYEKEDQLGTGNFYDVTWNRRTDRLDWCADFVSWVFQQAQSPIGPKEYPGRGFLNVVTFESELKKLNQWLTLSEENPPRRGDVVICTWEHVGILEKVIRDGQSKIISFDVIEGNTGDPEGGPYPGVFKRKRWVSEVKGFGRVL